MFDEIAKRMTNCQKIRQNGLTVSFDSAKLHIFFKLTKYRDFALELPCRLLCLLAIQQEVMQSRPFGETYFKSRGLVKKARGKT